MKQKLFEIKKILFTKAISDDVMKDCDFSEFVYSSLSKHLEDIGNNKVNVLSSFKYKDKRIYITTEGLGLEYINQDYPYTTVLYDYEY